MNTLNSVSNKSGAKHAGILFNFPAALSGLFPILKSYLWEPLAGLLVAPIWGMCCILPAIAGTIAFNGKKTEFQTFRVTVSCLILAGFYLAGNFLHFERNQWMWLHLFMCGQLVSLGFLFPATQVTNWVAFGLLALCYLSRAQRTTWELLDYVWGIYFAFLSFAVWKLSPQASSSES